MMTIMNPYAAQLGNRDPKEVISSTPGKIEKLFSQMTSARAEQPWAPGKWSPRQIICHLADCELVFSFRLRQTLAEDNPTLQPFDQDRWAKNYAAYSASEALAVFASARRWNCDLVKSLDASAFDRPANHPERGDLTFKSILEMMAGHDLNHLKQLEEVASRAA